jgi:hypothetical protein
MAHRNAVTHVTTWRSKNRAKYNEYQKLLVKKLREYEKISKRFRNIDISLFF